MAENITQKIATRRGIGQGHKELKPSPVTVGDRIETTTIFIERLKTRPHQNAVQISCLSKERSGLISISLSGGGSTLLK